MTTDVATGTTVDANIELFIEGHPFTYKSVVFSWNAKTVSEISPYFEWVDIEKVTQDKAREKIEKSKLVFDEFCGLSANLCSPSSG